MMGALFSPMLSRLLPWRALLWPLLAIGLGLLVFAWGHTLGTAKQQAVQARKDAATAAALADALVEDQRLANRASTALVARVRAERGTVQRIAKELAHAPTFAFAPGLCPTPAPAQASADGPAAAPAPASAPNAADVRLSLGAVRMWNGTHAGADLPAGACGTAGAPPGACAADSGVSITAAFNNALENAERQRECVTQLNALIDFEEARNARRPQP